MATKSERSRIGELTEDERDEEALKAFLRTLERSQGAGIRVRRPEEQLDAALKLASEINEGLWPDVEELRGRLSVMELLQKLQLENP